MRYKPLLCIGWLGINTTGNTFILLYHTLLLGFSRIRKRVFGRMVFALSKTRHQTGMSVMPSFLKGATTKTLSPTLRDFALARSPNRWLDISMDLGKPLSSPSSSYGLSKTMWGKADSLLSFQKQVGTQQWLCAFFSETNAVIEDGVEPLDLELVTISLKLQRWPCMCRFEKWSSTMTTWLRALSLEHQKCTSRFHMYSLAVWQLCI